MRRLWLIPAALTVLEFTLGVIFASAVGVQLALYPHHDLTWGIVLQFVVALVSFGATLLTASALREDMP